MLGATERAPGWWRQSGDGGVIASAERPGPAPRVRR